MADRTITAANSVLILTVPDLFPVGVQLQGFAADNIFETGDVTTKETVMGVDGRMSIGWIAAAVPFNLTLQADSASNDVFEAIRAAEQTKRESYILSLIARLPAIGRSYALTRGTVVSMPPIPSAGKTLTARRYSMMFEKLQQAPI